MEFSLGQTYVRKLTSSQLLQSGSLGFGVGEEYRSRLDRKPHLPGSALIAKTFMNSIQTYHVDDVEFPTDII